MYIYTQQIYTRLCVDVCFHSFFISHKLFGELSYGVATKDRLLKVPGLFCKAALFLWVLLPKRPENLGRLTIVATPYRQRVKRSKRKISRIFGIF